MRCAWGVIAHLVLVELGDVEFLVPRLEQLQVADQSAHLNVREASQLGDARACRSLACEITTTRTQTDADADADAGQQPQRQKAKERQPSVHCRRVSVAARCPHAFPCVLLLRLTRAGRASDQNVWQDGCRGCGGSGHGAGEGDKCGREGARGVGDCEGGGRDGEGEEAERARWLRVAAR